MTPHDLLMAGHRILTGRRPVLAIEITRECPLRCPGCYAYEEGHLGGGVTLRQLGDFRGDELVRAVRDLVDRQRPLHISIVGGDPLVRCRELEILLPELSRRKIAVQVVTSAFRRIPESWAALPRLRISVSIDGLPREHDERRKPTTYDRILRNISGGRITVHCTVTGQMMGRPGYLGEFLRFWAPRPEVQAIWMSFFTPQRGVSSPECLTPTERNSAINELIRLKDQFPKLDMGRQLIQEFRSPPASPEQCLFAQTTETISADLNTRIVPCQLGGDPDCARCGCMASMGMSAVANHKVAGVIPIWTLHKAAAKVGRFARTHR